jgi:hypothetical protein
LAGPESSEEEISHGDHLSHPLFPQLPGCFSSAQLFEVAKDLLAARLPELDLVFLRPEGRLCM